MSLRNKTLTDIIADCNFYEETIENPSYISSWTNKPAFTYNPTKKCRQLEELRLLYNPIRRENRMDKIFDYKINNPLHSNDGISKYEAFSKNNNFCIKIILIIISILTILWLLK